MDPSIATLRAVVTLRRTLHFGRAAAELGVSVSALSEQVSRLERVLGVPLFTRSSRAVAVTEVGEVVADRAQSVVDEHAALGSWLADVFTEAERSVRVGVLGGLDRGRVTALLRRVREELPAWEVSVQQVGFLGAGPALRSRRLDVVLTAGPVELAATDLRGTEVWHSRRMVMLERHHRLADRAEVTLDDLAGEVVIAASAGRSALTRRWVVDPRPDGTPVRYGPAAQDLEEAVQMVAAGMGVNLTATDAVTAVAHPDVVFVPLAGLPDVATWVLARAGERSLGVRAFEAAARAVTARPLSRRDLGTGSTGQAEAPSPG